MKPRPPFRYPSEQAEDDVRAARLAYATIFFQTTIVVAMYFALGNSQAMRTAWLEDLIGFVPAIAFLVARHFTHKRPTERFPFGFHQSSTIAYLVAATAILAMGCYILGDAVIGLAAAEHPTIGLVTIAGHTFWLGWLMILVLIYSIVPPVILGRLKLPLARSICNDALLADAEMQKADWMTGAAAIVGIVGIGFGFWWADGAAAALISLDVVNDGRKHVWRALKLLNDERPQATAKESRPSPVPDLVRRALLELSWIAEVGMQLREEGATVTGTVFLRLQPQADHPRCPADEARRRLNDVHWRLYEVQVILTSEVFDKE